MNIKTIVLLAVFTLYLWADMKMLPNYWHRDLNEAKKMALQEKKPILLFLHSRDCYYCPKMIEEIFPDPKLDKKLRENFVLLTLDGSTDADSIEEDVNDQAPERLITSMTPAYYFMGPKEEKLKKGGEKHLLIYGFWTVEQMDEWADDALKRFKRLYGKEYEVK